ncbi:MAG TPA: DHH family phosphoesterase [Candidatus Saccharimonadales bacterium]|nr:DHH family phosphoesterase [Candidatus Saccharimonadales bacterium]
MTGYEEGPAINEAVNQAQKIVIVQADNPDGDSMASSLALEEILGDMGKEVAIYCGVDVPAHLKYLPGSDRVVKELPNQFDLSILIDTASDALLEQLSKTGSKGWLAAKPSIVIDHHSTKPTITFASVICSHPAVAAGEVVYELAKQLGWQLNRQAKEYIAIAILSDSLGLTTESTTSRSIHIIAELVEGGVSLAQLENARRETMRRDPELVHYKGELLKRVEFASDGRIAMVTIPHDEIVRYSPLYNPPMLVLDDMRLATGVMLAIAFKIYDDGRITAKIRCNFGYGIADKLAEHFGGGGHPYAAGFRIQDGRPYEQVKSETIQKASDLLTDLENK